MTAVDMDHGRVACVARLCGGDHRVDAAVMDGQHLAFRGHTFDVVTCFEVLEHVVGADQLLTEMKRVLKSNGILLLTTPNRAARLLPLQRPWNREHVREYSSKGLLRLLRKHFVAFEILGISGEHPCHQMYLDRWRQDPLRVYTRPVRKIVSQLVPVRFKPMLRRLTMPVRERPSCPTPSITAGWPSSANVYKWPFYVHRLGGLCLNLLGICGMGREQVDQLVRQVLSLRGGSDFDGLGGRMEV